MTLSFTINLGGTDATVLQQIHDQLVANSQQLEKLMSFDKQLGDDVAANTADLAALQAQNATLIATLTAELAAAGTPSPAAQAALTQLEANNAAMVSASTPPTPPAA